MFEVLQNRSQIKKERKEMKLNGRSELKGPLVRWLRRKGLLSGLPIGDLVKSWDVSRTLSFIDENLPKDAAIVDLGSYCSEVPVSLASMGYINVTGVDLNPKNKIMPLADRVRYIVSDYMSTPFGSASFDAITSISAIEHGYDPERLFSEVSRLLKPGGYFIASLDYWPEKINTANTRFFDMTWLIFSEKDVISMLKLANRHGLNPAGELHLNANEKAINCAGFDYTFGWLVLKKE